MNQEVTKYFLEKDEPNKSCLLALRDVILKQDDLITETVKYGMPCFCYKKKMFCYLWTDKKSDQPYILMVEGQLLKNPQLIAGSRKRMKVYNVDPEEDLPIEDIESLLQEALDLYRNNVIKIK